MLENISYPILEILSNSLTNNLSVLQKHCGNKNMQVLIPVKANAYGCGLNIIVQYLQTYKNNNITNIRYR